jgi:hypothetical protein
MLSDYGSDIRFDVDYVVDQLRSRNKLPCLPTKCQMHLRHRDLL